MALVKYIWKTSQMIVMLTLNKAFNPSIKRISKELLGYKKSISFIICIWMTTIVKANGMALAMDGSK